MSKVILYVKSVKTVTGTVEAEREIIGRQPGRPDRAEIEGSRAGGKFRVRLFQTETGPKYEFVLPEDQKKVVEMVREAAYRLGLEVEVVDVARENPLHRIFQKELEKIEVFPTLLTDSEMLMSDFAKERIEDFLSKAETERKPL